MKLFKKSYDENQWFRHVIFVLIVICMIVGVACFRFYVQVQQTIKDESEHYLREISNRISSNIERTIEDNFAILKTMRSVLESDEIQTEQQLSNFLHEQENYWDFNTVMLINENGVAFDFEGKEVSITGDSFLRNLSNDKAIIAPSQIINNEEMLIFASPIQLHLNNMKVEAIATCYDPEEFHELLSMSSFDKKAYSYIVDKNGKAITRSKSVDDDKFGYNIIHSIKNNNQNNQEDVEQLRKDMAAEKGNQYRFTIAGASEYLIYTPIALDGWELFSFVPESVVNAKSNLLLRNTLLIIGLIFIVFSFFLLIIFLSFSRHKKRLEQIAYVDALTGGDSIQRFHERVKEELWGCEKDEYALIFTNIQRFKVLNDQFGRTICDTIIQSVYDGIVEELAEDEYIAHQSADNFSVLIKYEAHEVLKERLKNWHANIYRCVSKKLRETPQFIMEYGIYVIDNPTIPIDDMLDRTKLALRSNVFIHTQNDYIHYAFYDDATRSQLLKEKNLEDKMDQALRDGEFKMYLQPKYLLTSETIGGAEALVRWVSKDDGMIFPNEFIPLFEKNGFIIKLDLWMFEQACQLLQKWQDEGKPLLTISINCSRAHLKNINFLDAYAHVFEKYTIPAHYLELEFTENMVFDDTQRLIKVIDQIHALGFSCSMDDFGSGYSSLNLLQDIHVDTLKLDRIFFKPSFSEDERAKAIVSSVLDMAQSLKMKTVAEGVEQNEQVTCLHKMGCDYVQGFVFAKPMPIEEFETTLFNHTKGEHHEDE